MEEKIRTEKDVWDEVKRLLGNKEIRLGQHWSFNLYNDPKRLSFVLSRYKFAAKMSSRDRNILELGCSEGIGAPILSETAKSYTGVDMDVDAIDAAKKNLSFQKLKNDDKSNQQIKTRFTKIPNRTFCRNGFIC